MWLSSGRLTNPALNQVLLDTGPLPAASRLFQAWISSTAQAALEIQHVDAAGTGILKSQIIAVPSYGFTTMPKMIYPFDMALNECIRIIAVAAITGSVSVSLNIE